MPKDAIALRARVKHAIVQRYWCSRFVADTAHGIYTSWLPEKGLVAASPTLVADVLAELVNEEVLCEQRVTGGKPIFRRGPKFVDGMQGR